jgi:hypothetical protein
VYYFVDTIARLDEVDNLQPTIVVAEMRKQLEPKPCPLVEL